MFNSWTSLEEREKETCPSHGLKGREKKKFDQISFYVKLLEIHRGDGEGDMSNSWTQKRDRELHLTTNLWL